MTKGLKIAAITLSVIVVLIGGVLVFLYWRKKHGGVQVQGVNVGGATTAPATVRPGALSMSLSSGPVNKSLPGSRLPVSFGSTLKNATAGNAGNAMQYGVSGVTDPVSEDLHLGCQVLISRLPDSDPIKYQMSKRPVDLTLWKDLVMVWFGKIKADLGKLTNVLDNNNLTTKGNALFEQIALFDMSCFDAANSLVWLDTIIRQTAIEERINLYTTTFYNTNFNYHGMTFKGSDLITQDGSYKVTAADFNANNDLWRKTLLVAQDTWDYDKSIPPPAVHPFLNHARTLALWMGDNSSLGGSEATLGDYEAQANSYLDGIRKQFFPTSAEINAQMARDRAEQAGFISLALSIISFGKGALRG